MKKFKQYSFYIGIIGALIAVTSVILNFFEITNIMPVITEILAVVSAILVSVGVVEKDTKDKTFDDIKNEIKTDLDKKANTNTNCQTDIDKKDATNDKSKDE